MKTAARLACTLLAAAALTACTNEVEHTELPAPAAGHAVSVETLVEGLHHPWSLAFLPGGDMLITERSGALRLVQDRALREEPVSGVPDVLALSQGGLMEVVLAPDFEETGEIFLSFAYGTARSNNTALYRARYEDGALQDGEIIWQSRKDKTGGAHFGGRIAFLPDETLLLTLGDGFEFREEAQSLSNHFGTIVRLDRDGSAPADNPFAGREDALADIWSYGHRNVQGIVYDGETGAVWSHEHGPRGGDELNLITPGSNYGWPIVTSGLDYSGARITPFTEHEGRFTAPVREWLPTSIAPAGMTIYRGEAFASWNGDLLITALAGQALHRVVIENGQAVAEEKLLDDLGLRLRDVRVGPDGLVYVLTDHANGALLRLSPAD
ncbi:MAG: PQQ-dependent sugar dehydrogenase [Oceanicaulis sp.]|uniref:PQQ-dependent sugar dehydrogenase n=1 Tax=Glycocaulis sp. TaxID=1969725 RepID=UPI0025C03476|nr:PQQ-dependent sugar dehydrogenase [Glycocaulis sp.]MCC5982286.1 PQQ-dependent sugar dehydrogenase [Oceanicaulis sp.]MCH8520720.1 PQQ-dependent sugar dehydrogenase [Glycocaulis sp.]